MASARLLVVVIFATLPFDAFGAAVCWFSWRRIDGWRTDRDRYEPVRATVTAAEAVPVDGRDGIYRPSLTVEYEFRGRIHETEPGFDVDTPTGTERNVREFLDDLRTGSVTVHVDPRDPGNPVLPARDRPPVRAFALFVVGLASVCVGVGTLGVALLAVFGVV